MDLFNTKIPSTESRSHLNDSYEPFVSDISNGLYRSDHFSVAESSYSFSVVCRPYAMDYPFPSIHNQAQSEEYLDPQFSVDCVYGGGSMLSSLDLSLDSCLEEEGVMTPVRSIDLRSIVDQGRLESAPGFVGNHVSAQKESISCESTVKEPNPVEFRSGYRGVSWNRRMKAWLAFWSEGKNRRSKTFNAKVMGFEKARAAAIDFLKKKKQLLQQVDDVGYGESNGSSESTNNFEDEDFGEGGSLADSATTTSDSPNSSEMLCASCGGSCRQETVSVFGTRVPDCWRRTSVGAGNRFVEDNSPHH